MKGVMAFYAVFKFYPLKGEMPSRTHTQICQNLCVCVGQHFPRRSRDGKPTQRKQTRRPDFDSIGQREASATKAPGIDTEGRQINGPGQGNTGKDGPGVQEA